MPGVVKQLETTYTSDDGSWNVDLLYDDGSTSSRKTLPFLEGFGELLSDKGDIKKGSRVYFTIPDASAKQEDSSPTKSGVHILKVTTELSELMLDRVSGVAHDANGKPTNTVVFYRAGDWQSSTKPAFTFLLRIDGVQYKFMPALPDLSTPTPGCVPASPSTIVIQHSGIPDTICGMDTPMRRIDLGNKTPMAAPGWSGQSSPAVSPRNNTGGGSGGSGPAVSPRNNAGGGGGGPPEDPNNPLGPDPPGQNVMLVVLLLGAVLALANCMPCK